MRSDFESNARREFLESCRPYEIYPVSFYDSNGDGIGDLRGIINQLDYLEDLGVNLIWINPFFESPFRDGGYDITDYYKVDPRFGSNADAEELFAKAKEKGIRIMLDLVMGHTSDQHPWFLESQKQDRNEYSDLYIWNNQTYPMDDSRYGTFMCGCAERPNSYRVNYYAHQPALNFGYYKPKEDWQVSHVSDIALKNQERVVDVIRYWLNLGAAGYRVDMAGDMVKNDKREKGNIAFWKRIFHTVRKEFPEAIFLPEWNNVTRCVKKAGFDMAGIWTGMLMDYNDEPSIGKTYFHKGPGRSIVPFLLYFGFNRRQAKANGYVSFMMSCHDNGRINKAKGGYTDDELKVIHAFIRTMPMISYCYMGEEIGIPARQVRSKDAGYARTSARTPMQWDHSKNLGFSVADEIYLPVEEDSYTHHTVEDQLADPNSLLQAVKEINRIKAEVPCFRASAKFKVKRIGRLTGYPFIFERKEGDSRAIVIISPDNKSHQIDLKKYKVDEGYHSGYTAYCANAEVANGVLTTQGPSFAIFYR